MQESGNARLPVPSVLTWIWVLSVVTVLTAGISIYGWVCRGVVYPTKALRRMFVAIDVVNLVIGIPVLVGVSALICRGRLTGLLALPGALLFVLYNYAIYVLAMPFGAVYVSYLALIGLSASALLHFVVIIDRGAVRQRLKDRVRERTAGAILAGFGSLFLLHAIGGFLRDAMNHASVSRPDVGVNIADLLLAPAWIAGGIFLYRRRAFGYVIGLGLLLQGCMLFFGLIALLLLQPRLTGAVLDLTGVVTVLAMSVFIVVPLVLFVRGVESSQRL